MVKKCESESIFKLENQEEFEKHDGLERGASESSIL